MTSSAHIRLDIEDAPRDSDVEALPNGLEAFNESRWPGHQQWKPLAVFGGPKGLRFSDAFTSVGGHDGKEHHEWGQDFGAFQTIVERFTEPDQLIVDPLMGGGTTLLAAQSLGRHSVGCDISPKAVESVKARAGISSSKEFT